jgi:hypothetical protein
VPEARLKVRVGDPAGTSALSSRAKHDAHEVEVMRNRKSLSPAKPRGPHTRRQHHHPSKGFPRLARVERALLPAAFDFALGLAFDFAFDSAREVRGCPPPTAPR